MVSASDPTTHCFDTPRSSLSLAMCVQVKLWRLCDPEVQQHSSPELTLYPGQGRLELVLFHPTSSGLLAVGATNSPMIWDTGRQDAPLAGSYSWRHVRHMYTLLFVRAVYITHTKLILSYTMHCLLHLTFQSLSVSLRFLCGLFCFYVQYGFI